jgi:thiol-disulfide isomerase/thioredoxin
MRRLIATTTGLAAALLLSACTGAADSTDAGAAASPAPTAESEPATPDADTAGTDEPEPAATGTPDPIAVPAQLDFTAATVDGGTFDGATLAGQDAVLYFWAPWCTICRAEAPALPVVAEEFDGQVTFLGVAGLSPDVAAMQGFVDDTGTGSLTHIADTDGTVYTGFGVASQTTFAFVDDDGTIEIVPGPIPADELRERTTALVAS